MFAYKQSYPLFSLFQIILRTRPVPRTLSLIPACTWRAGASEQGNAGPGSPRRGLTLTPHPHSPPHTADALALYTVCVSMSGQSSRTNLPWKSARAFQGAPVVKKRSTSAGDVRGAGLIPKSGRSPGEGNGNALVFLPGESHGQRSLVDCSPQGLKESHTTEATEHARLHARARPQPGPRLSPRHQHVV